MQGHDPRRVDANIYICEAIRVLQMAQLKHLRHTDMTTVQEALDGLGAVQRSIAGAAVTDEARVAARLRQVATAVKSCTEPAASSAYADIEAAGEFFRSPSEKS